MTDDAKATLFIITVLIFLLAASFIAARVELG